MLTHDVDLLYLDAIPVVVAGWYILEIIEQEGMNRVKERSRSRSRSRSRTRLGLKSRTSRLRRTAIQHNILFVISKLTFSILARFDAQSK